MSLSQIRNRINALPLAVYRLRPLAEEFCHQWSVAEADRKPAPESQPFVRKIALAGFRLPTFMELHKYKERALWRILGQTNFEDGIAAERVSGEDVLRRLNYPGYFKLLEAAPGGERRHLVAPGSRRFELNYGTGS